MNKWPEKGPAYFEDLIRPVIKAIKFAYSLQRKNKGRSIPWTGPPRESGLSCCPDHAEMLKAHNLKYSEEDQGRDALEEIVGIAIALGIDQGQRITKKEDGLYGDSLNIRMIKLILEGPGTSESKLQSIRIFME